MTDVNYFVDDRHHARQISHIHKSAFYRHYGKRCFDIILALILLPFLTPVIIILWGLTSLDGASGLFGHKRVGKHGRAFRCWKIRSMVANSDARLASYLAANPQAAAQWNATQKLSYDPRITKFGTFLRRSSLDELPQIWNVLKGDMSFVGPRPVTTEELDRYGRDRGAYLALRPGITGLWQVYGRQDGCYEKRVHLDRTYNISLGWIVDINLIIRTGSCLFKFTGS